MRSGRAAAREEQPGCSALLASALADVEAADDAYFITLEQGREEFLAALGALVAHNP